MRNKTALTVIVWLLFLAWPLPLASAPQEPDVNVNSRYTVDAVEVHGVSESKIDKAIVEDMHKLVGEKFSQKATDELAERLRKQLTDYSVEAKVQRGSKTDFVKIVFEAERIWWKKFDVAGSRLVYHSKQGWSGRLSATLDSHHNAVTVGFVNSADEYLERHAGLLLGYEHQKLGSDRLRLRLGFESSHEKWNPATESALAERPDVPGVYRTRQDFAPSLSVLPWRDLQLSVGVSFQRLQMQYPSLHTERAYSGTFGASYRRRFEDPLRQRVSIDYTVRSATRVLDSDFVYTRHAFDGRYSARHGRNYFALRAGAGILTGNAPMFERFSLGNSTTLRGWNKFDVAPLGGTRAVYGSLEYGYSGFRIFYDAGAVWDDVQGGKTRHSIGFGWADKHGAFLLLGFPLRQDHVAPVLTFGIGF